MGKRTIRNRCVALTIIFFSFLQFPLNWFSIIPAFSPIAAAMHLELPQIGLLVSAFIAGYGIAHIPAGVMAEALGIRTTLLIGIAMETIGTVLSATAQEYSVLFVSRFICGVGGSIYIGCAIGLTAAWFRDRNLVTATGLVTGVAFAIGAVAGLFAWGLLIQLMGWRMALSAGAAIGLLTFVVIAIIFPEPPLSQADDIGGSHLDSAALKRVFGDVNLWLLGIAFLGGYGAYFITAQLLPDYAQHALGLSPTAAQLIGTITLVAGIPGSFLGGWLADRVFGALPVFFGACIVEGITLFAIPYLGPLGIEFAAGVIGGVFILGFVAWISTPGLYRKRIHLSDVPTAAGMLLTFAAIGGVAAPVVYTHVVGRFGYAAGWHFAAAICIVTSFACLGTRRPQKQVVRSDTTESNRDATA